MTENQIKKLVELAELANGFDISLDKMKKPLIQYKNSTQYLEDIDEWEHYPLLLYRLVEGWNKKEIANRTGNALWIDPESVHGYYNCKDIFEEYDDYQGTLYLTAQEQALEVALEEVL